jgi:putative Flp pilus-assembly TadE/G-like protein
MNRRNKHERGQALILIVFAIVAMIGLTGLAIDGGNAYSDRRHAQNAADTAVMAAALARIRQDPTDPGIPADAWKSAGYQMATSNGYPQAGPSSTVVVSLCSEPGVTCTLPATVDDGKGNQVTTDPSQFVKVSIASTVSTYFAPVLGIRELHNQVEAIARAIPIIETTYFNGAALASIMPGCKNSDWNYDPFVVGGSSTTTISGSELFVNSTCNPDFTTNGGFSLTANSGICLVGTAESGLTGITGTITEGCSGQIDPQQYNYPQVDDACAALGDGHIDTIGGVSYAYPGNYHSNFPSGNAGKLIIEKGLYCLHNGFDLHSGNWNMTTDVNGNHFYDSTEGAMFYVPSGDVTFNGGSQIDIHAVTVPGCDQQGLNGLLIYLPMSNDSPVGISGNAGSTFTGTILAPKSLITLTGTGDSSSGIDLQTQIIGYSVKITGSGYLNINYDPCVTTKTYTKPKLQPYK